MFHLVLHQPQIAPNTGNLIRLVANNGCHLHLIKPMGFDLEEKKLRRAGLDYHDMARVHLHENFEIFLQAIPDFHTATPTLYAITTKGTRSYTQATFNPWDILVFGSETAGLPEAVMKQFAPEHRLKIPMLPDSRSLNLSNAVAIVSYEAWRQLDFQQD